MRTFDDIMNDLDDTRANIAHYTRLLDAANLRLAALNAEAYAFDLARIETARMTRIAASMRACAAIE